MLSVQLILLKVCEAGVNKDRAGCLNRANLPNMQTRTEICVLGVQNAVRILATCSKYDQQPLDLMSLSRIFNAGDVIILKESLDESCWNVEINGSSARVVIFEIEEDYGESVYTEADANIPTENDNNHVELNEVSEKLADDNSLSLALSEKEIDEKSLSKTKLSNRFSKSNYELELKHLVKSQEKINYEIRQEDDAMLKTSKSNRKQFQNNAIGLNSSLNTAEATLLTSINQKLSLLLEDLYNIKIEIQLLIKAINEWGGSLIVPDFFIENSPEQKILDKMLEHPYLPIFKDSKGQIHDSIALSESRCIYYIELLTPDINLGYLSESDCNLLSELDFDIFPYKESKDEKIVCLFLMSMFYQLDLPNIFRISDTILYRFLLSVYRKYRAVPFHNFYHAFNVTQTAYYMIVKAQAKKVLGSLEIMAILIAAMCHDLDHPGLNNDFQRQAQTRVFHMHKKSVLENHHYLTCMSLLARPETNILMNLTEEQESKMYIYLRDLILATDLAVHGLILKSLSERKKTCAKFFKSGSSLGMSLEDKKLIMIAIIKCSDLSNEIRKQSMSRRWAKLVIAEFFAQSDKERELDFKVTPFMDKHKIIIAQEQINFIEKLCLPLYTPLAVIFPELENCIRTMVKNRNSWQQLLKSFFTDPSELKKLSNKSIWEREQVKIKGDLYNTLAARATKSDIPKARRQNLVKVPKT